MFNANLEVHTHNEYYLKLINTKTNKVTEYTAKNFICIRNLVQGFLRRYWERDVSNYHIKQICVMDSTLRQEYNTAVDDSDWWKQAPEANVSRKGYRGFQGDAKVESLIVNNNTIKTTLSITFPATSSYVVNAANRVCITNAYYRTNTSYPDYPSIITLGHIKDSEGNDTTLKKTADDVLIVTASMYFQINTEDSMSNTIETGFVAHKNIEYINPILAPFCNTATNSILPQRFTGFRNTYSVALYISNTKYRPYKDRMYYSQGCKFNNISNKDILFYYNDSYSHRDEYWTFNDEDKSGVFTAYKQADNNSIKEFTKDSFNGHYITYLVLGGLGYFELPNEKIFPKYTLTDIPIQSTNEHPIDGVNKEFKHPLSYFVKDSEIIKVNGTALTRGTDYTVDSYNNQDMLPELMWNCFVCEREGRVFWDISHKATTCAIRWFDTLCRYNAYDGTSFSKYSTWEGNHEDYWDNKIADTITSLKPLILTLDKEYTINYLRMPGFAVYKFNDLENTIDSTWTAYSCDYCTVFEYSLDKTTWTEFHRVKSLNYDVEGSHSEITTDFEKYLDTPITAKYIRIRLEFTNEFKPADNNEIFVLSDSSNTKLNPNMSDSVYHCGTIGYVGGNIKFTEAPPENATITFTCDCDLPYKTDQYKMYIDASLKLTIKQGNVAPIEEITSEG